MAADRSRKTGEGVSARGTGQQEKEEPRAVAIVSGKGGSGKTLIAVQMGFELAEYSRSSRVILMDADIGTAGMSFYLGYRYVHNTRTGLSDVILDRNKTYAPLLQDISVPSGNLRYLPVGDYRRINREYRARNPDLAKPPPIIPVLREAIRELREEADFLIVDCRGGIDDESLGVCSAVDDIIMIVEQDPTSFQASRYLVDTLAEVDLVHKLRGYIINKVYANPEPVRRNGTVDFASQCLAAVPVDLEAMRAFLLGQVPAPSGLFGVHIQDALSRAYPAVIRPPAARILSDSDYDKMNVFDPVASLGGVITAIVLLTVGTGFVVDLVTRQTTPRTQAIVVVAVLAVIGAAAAAIASTRTFIRRGAAAYVGFLRRLFRLGRGAR